MQHNEWKKEAYAKVIGAIARCYRNSHIGGWNENNLTTAVLESLESIGLDIDWSDKPQRVRWEGFKLTGKAEEMHGDIAIIVRIWITKDRYIDGVAYYEAKRQFFDKNNGRPVGFTSLKKNQISRIHSFTHSSNILLYDMVENKTKVRASSIPMVFVKELIETGYKSMAGKLLHEYGEPWVISLAKNFIGLQLDFSEKAIEEIKKSTSSYRKPSFVLNAAVGISKFIEPELENSFIQKTAYEHWIKPKTPSVDNDNDPDLPGPGFKPK